MPNIAQNINRISERIEKAAKKVGRASSDITLLAVSKGHPASAVKTAYQYGLKHFGESYLQEALQKLDDLASFTDITWHFVGPLQSNKTRKVAQRFDWVHSIDRVKVAQRLNEQRPADKAPLNVCLQVNIDNETSKAGVVIDELPHLAAAVAKLPNLKLRGLMVIPKATENITQQRLAFSRTAEILQELKQRDPELAAMDTLSMGMSGDMEAAIIEGATIVRVGTGIFGRRQTVSKSSN